jgi:hypothetical protein
MENNLETPMETPEKSASAGRGRSPGSRRTQFQPGHSRHENGEVPSALSVESDQLADMRHVYANPANLDTTHAQKTCRKWMNSNLKDFMAVKSRLEDAALQRSGSAATLKPSSDAVEPDETSERVMRLLEDQLDRINDKLLAEADQFVKDGRCACCGQQPVPGMGEAGRIIADSSYAVRLASREQRRARRESGYAPPPSDTR